MAAPLPPVQTKTAATTKSGTAGTDLRHEVALRGRGEDETVLVLQSFALRDVQSQRDCMVILDLNFACESKNNKSNNFIIIVSIRSTIKMD